jgi:virginiamycin B lyase
MARGSLFVLECVMRSKDVAAIIRSVCAIVAVVSLSWSVDAPAQTFSEFVIPTANSFPVGITAGPDGAVWFVESGGNSIGRITTAGVVTEFRIPTANSTPIGITAGPDGALWFTENGANKIGRITTAGIITEFPVPTANSDLVGITAGPDGALWFTEFLGNKIGRITAGDQTQGDGVRLTRILS